MKRTSKPKPLILMNGRTPDCRGAMYVAAHSKADAARLMMQAFPGCYVSEAAALSEIRVYFNVGLWGKRMDDVEPERGVWVIHGEYTNNPCRTRLILKEAE